MDHTTLAEQATEAVIALRDAGDAIVGAFIANALEEYDHNEDEAWGFADYRTRSHGDDFLRGPDNIAAVASVATQEERDAAYEEGDPLDYFTARMVLRERLYDHINPYGSIA